MSHLKRYTISLAVKTLDGHRVSCEWEVKPIGSSDTNLDSLWMLLLRNLHDDLRTARLEVVASSQSLLRDEHANL